MNLRASSGGDAPALEVEQLGLVDRAHRRGVRCAPAVRLVDLERRDRDGAGRLATGSCRTRPGSCPCRSRVFSIVIRPFMYVRARSSSTPLDSSCPVVSRPTWRVYEVRSCSWSSDAEHDLHLLDRAPVAGEHVVHARADEAAAQLGERPAQVRALADVGAPLLEHDVVRAQSPGGWPSPSRAWAPSRISVVARQERLGAGPRRRRTRPAPRRPRPRRRPEDDERAADQRSAGRRRPAQDDRPLDADAGRDVHDACPGVQAARDELGELLVGGEQRRRRRAARGRAPRPWRPARRSVSRRTPAAAALASIERGGRRRPRAARAARRRPSGARRGTAPAIRRRGVRAWRRRATAARRSTYGV